MLQPKRTKFRKVHKGRNRGLAQGTDVSFGTFGLKAVGRGRLTARQIEAARRAMTRAVKRQGKIWIRVFPDKPITETGNDHGARRNAAVVNFAGFAIVNTGALADVNAHGDHGTLFHDHTFNHF